MELAFLFTELLPISLLNLKITSKISNYRYGIKASHTRHRAAARALRPAHEANRGPRPPGEHSRHLVALQRDAAALPRPLRLLLLLLPQGVRRPRRPQNTHAFHPREHQNQSNERALFIQLPSQVGHNQSNMQHLQSIYQFVTSFHFPFSFPRDTF